MYPPLREEERGRIMQMLYKGDVFYPWIDWPADRKVAFLEKNKSKMDTKSVFCFFWRNGIEPDKAMWLACAWGSNISKYDRDDTIRLALENPDGLKSVSPNIWAFEREGPIPGRKRRAELMRSPKRQKMFSSPMRGPPPPPKSLRKGEGRYKRTLFREDPTREDGSGDVKRGRIDE